MSLSLLGLWKIKQRNTFSLFLELSTHVLSRTIYNSQYMKATKMSINWGVDKEVWYIYTIGEGNGNPLQYSCLENSMDRGAWWSPVHGVTKSRTRLSDSHSLTDIYTIEYYSVIRPWCWERLKAGGEGDDRGWDGWIPSQTRSTQVWASSRSW